MAKAVRRGDKSNPLSSLWGGIMGLDKFSKFVLASFLLIAISVPYISNNPQILTQHASNKNQQGPDTITINPTPTPALGATVTFTVSYTEKLKYPRVEVLCYSDAAKTDLIYGEAGSANQALGNGQDSLGYDGFLLGGGSSIWLNDMPTSPAYCTANLFYFDNSGKVQKYVQLATTSFNALGRQQ